MNPTSHSRQHSSQPLTILLYGEHGLTYQGSQIIKALRNHNVFLHILSDADLYKTVGDLHEQAQATQLPIPDVQGNPLSSSEDVKLTPLTHVPQVFFESPGQHDAYPMSLMIFCTHNPDEINPLFETFKKFGCGADIQTVLTHHNKDWSLSDLLNHTQQEHALVGDFIKLSGLTREVSKFLDMFDIPDEQEKSLRALNAEAFETLKSEDEPDHEKISAVYRALHEAYLSLTKRAAYAGGVILEVQQDGEKYTVHAQPSEGDHSSFKFTWSDGEEGPFHAPVSHEHLKTLTCNAYALGNLHGVITGAKLCAPQRIPADACSWKAAHITDTGSEIKFLLSVDKIAAARNAACDPLKNTPQPTHLVVRVCSSQVPANEVESTAQCTHYQEYRLDLAEILDVSTSEAAAGHASVSEETTRYASKTAPAAEHVPTSNHVSAPTAELHAIETAATERSPAARKKSHVEISLLSAASPQSVVVALENCVGVGDFTLVAPLLS